MHVILVFSPDSALDADVVLLAMARICVRAFTGLLCVVNAPFLATLPPKAKRTIRITPDIPFVGASVKVYNFERVPIFLFKTLVLYSRPTFKLIFAALLTDRRASALGDDTDAAASPAASEGKGKPEGKAKKGAKDKKGDQGKGKNAPSPMAASDSSATDNDARAVRG